MLSILIEKAEQIATINLQSSIVNNQFPDKSGFTFRYNRIARVGLKKLYPVKK